MENIALKLIEEKLQSLPKDLNQVISNKFKEVENQKEHIRSQEKERIRLVKELKNNSESLTKTNVKITILEALKIRKEELDKKENELTITLLKHELEVSRQSKLDIYNLVNMFMKNPRAIEILNTSYVTQLTHSSEGLVNGAEKISEFGTKEKTETKDE